MGQVLHGSARTTAAVRRAIQHSQASIRALAERHGFSVFAWYRIGLGSVALALLIAAARAG